MVVGRVKLLALAVALLAIAGTAAPAGAVAQPSYDTLRVSIDGTSLPYEVWVAWSPLVLTTADGGAWAFFSAQAVAPDGLGTKKLYVSRFEPALGVWLPSTALPGGEIQFGATGVIDQNGTIHVIYSDRLTDAPDAYSTLVHIMSTPEGGWTEPVAVAPNETAGHQLSPSLAMDGTGTLHLVWQDQRSVSDELRAASPANADIFACTLNADGVCGDVQTLTTRTADDVNASRPKVVSDGNRLVAIWSIYVGSTPEALETAERVEWSMRDLGQEGAAWAAPQTIVERNGGLIGGRLVDLAADPTGGAVVVYGRRTTENVLYLSRLAADASTWSEPLPLVSGDRGSFPSVAVAANGTAYAVYNIGSSTAVQVGGVALAAGQDRASTETVLSQGEDGAQGRAVLDIDDAGRLWMLYLHEPTGGVANEVRVLRGAVISSEPAAEPVATPLPIPATPVATPQA